jgi:hypothetical protein
VTGHPSPVTSNQSSSIDPFEQKDRKDHKGKKKIFAVFAICLLKKNHVQRSGVLGFLRGLFFASWRLRVESFFSSPAFLPSSEVFD